MVRVSLCLAMLLSLGCGLEELIAEYTVGAGGAGAAAGGQGQGGHAGQGGQGAACGAPTFFSAERASFTTQSTEPEEVLSLDLPGDVAPDGWVVLFSARLKSQSTAPES